MAIGEYYKAVLNVTDFLGGFYPLTTVCAEAGEELQRDWDKYWGRFDNATVFITKWGMYLTTQSFKLYALIAKVDEY